MGKPPYRRYLWRPIAAVLGLLLVVFGRSLYWPFWVGAGVILGLAALQIIDLFAGAARRSTVWTADLLVWASFVAFGVGLFGRIASVGYAALGALGVSRVEWYVRKAHEEAPQN